MATAKISYEQHLRTLATHEKSGEKIITDAPIDNHGQGAAFSPTDLMATSLVSCMITIMGIRANTKSIELVEVKSSMQKTMASNPRRISAIDVSMRVVSPGLSMADQMMLKSAAESCPVAQSLSRDISQSLTIEFITN